MLGPRDEQQDAGNDQAGDRGHKDQYITQGLRLLRIVLAAKCSASEAAKQLTLPIAKVRPSTMVPA